MARTITLLAAALLALSSPAFAVAQDEPPAAATGPATAAAVAREPVEEVVVRGRRTLFSLRREMQDARENVWQVFSAINSDDAFDITCTSAAQTGTRVKSRACRPRYANDATSRAGQDLARRMSACDPRSPDYGVCLEGAMAAGTGEAQAQLAIIPYMDKRLDDEFHRLAAEQPELATAILEYLSKQHEYEEAVRSREDPPASSQEARP